MALKKIIEFLQQYKKTPQNGWIIFSGYTFEQVWRVIEPPLPVKRTYYFCDRKFRTELFADLFVEHKEYNIFVIDAECAKLYKWKHGDYHILYKHEVDIATNSRRGGFSANRYRRNREIKKNLLYDTIAAQIPKDNLVILCGYSEMIKEVNQKLAECKISVIDTILMSSVMHDSFDKDFLAKITMAIAKYEFAAQYQVYEEFERLLVENMDLCIFGLKEIKKYDEMGLVKKIITSGDSQKFACKDVTFVPKVIMEKYGDCVGVLFYKIGEF